MQQLLASRRARSFLVAAAGLAAVLLYTQLIMSRATPVGVLYDGFAIGLVNALTAVGLILVYRTVRVINFAQSALGAAGAVLCFDFVHFTKIPFIVAFLLGVLLSGALGLLYDLIFGRRFFNAPRLVVTTLTIIAAAFLGIAASTFVDRLSLFPKLDARDPFPLTPAGLGARLPLRGFHYTIGGDRFGFTHLFAIEVSLAAILLIAAFFRYTKAGVAVRAMAENASRAELLGISVGSLSTIVWTISGLLAGLSVILTGMLVAPNAAAGFAPSVLLFALAAAVLARLESIPVAVFAAVLFSMLNRALVFSNQANARVMPLVLFIVVSGGLLIQRKTLLRSEEGAGATWSTTEEQRPIPVELRDVPTVKWGRRALILIGLALVIVYPFVVSTSAVSLGAIISLNAIIALSLVVLTGWAGQVSLGQVGFAAVGAVVGAALTGRYHVPFWFAIPIAASFTAAFAALVGVPALRIKGLFLAITTFAFGLAASNMLFDTRYFGWLLPKDVKRPTLLFLDFRDEKSMYFLCALTLVVSIVIVLNLRRSRVGRILIASRENEANLQSFGVGLVRAKIQAFAIAGGLAGLAGAMLVHQLQSASVDLTIGGGTFSSLQSVQIFVLAVIGGITSVGGALLGSAYGSAAQYFFTRNPILASLAQAIPLYILYITPGGFISIITAGRDSVLRIVAQRRQLIVPSLFADYDPDALQRRLVPLADPLPSSGLNALRPDQRFAQESELYRGTGDHSRARDRAAARNRDADAIGAAAQSAQ